ncbi:MAG: hypothetical protein Q9225_000761 [Loekoesia sp. 1 TL-2023]
MGCVQANKQEKQQPEPAQKQIESVPLPATHTINPAPAPTQRVSQTVKKAVSFSEKLTRGPGRSYTPPTNEKGVRFAATLVRGEGSAYGDLSPRKSEVYPFDHSTASTVERSQSPGHQSPSCASKSRLGKSVSTKPLQSINMGSSDQSETQKTQTAFDTESDSDDSFTDIVTPSVLAEENALQHRAASSRYHRNSEGTTSSTGLSRSMQGQFSGGQSGSLSKVGEDESYIAAVTMENTRRNSLSEGPPNLSGFNAHMRKYTATAPSFNRYSYRLRANSIGSSVLGQPTRRSWPQPVFVWRGKNPPTVFGHPSPVFALRNNSNSGKPVTTTLTKQQAKRRYQPPSVIDDGVDDAVYVNLASRMTCRDV